MHSYSSFQRRAEGLSRRYFSSYKMYNCTLHPTGHLINNFVVKWQQAQNPDVSTMSNSNGLYGVLHQLMCTIKVHTKMLYHRLNLHH